VHDGIVYLATPYFLKIKEILDQIKGGSTDKINGEWYNNEFLVLAISTPFRFNPLKLAR
jgi:hypothetical protein